MPANYSSIRVQIMDQAGQAVTRANTLRDKRESARQTLALWAGDLDEIKLRVEKAVAEDSGLRCAVPYCENLMARVPCPRADENTVIISADGSQIAPSRHDPVEFALINVGAFRYARRTTPAERVESQLIMNQDLYVNNSLASEDYIALLRDVRERTMLADLAEEEDDGPVITLTDGQLELFQPPSKSQEFESGIQDYLEALRAIAGKGTTAGYVDRPHAALLVRLLELLRADPQDKHPFGGVTDADMLGRILMPGERSAVFKLRSTTAVTHYKDDLELYFFYLNVSQNEKPHLAQVEIPRWVAKTPEMLDNLHANLVEQSRILAKKPYPWALQRAHEIAVISFQEKELLQDMIIAELGRRGIMPGDYSNKQSAKNSSGQKTRYA